MKYRNCLHYILTQRCDVTSDCYYADSYSIQTNNNKEWVVRRKSKNITKAWEIHDVIVEHGSRVHRITRSDWSDKD